MGFKSGLFFLAVAAIAPHCRAQHTNESDDWRYLLTDSLDGWEVFTGVPHNTTVVPGFPQSESEDCRSGNPVGLSDPLSIFSIRQQDGEPHLHVSGQGYAGISSLESFSNYHLSLQYKWGEKKYPPRINQKRDSGVLVHCTGPHGAFWNVWLRSLECQIQETDTGDFIALAGVSAKSNVDRLDGSKPAYVADGQERVVGAGTGAWGMQRHQNHEKPGQWNQVDILTVEDEVLFAVNGHVVMRLSETKIGPFSNGTTLKEGRIQIQSEAAEIDYRRIRIRPLHSMPEGSKIAIMDD